MSNLKGYKRKETSETLSKAGFLAEALRGINRLKADLEKQMAKRDAELETKIEGAIKTIMEGSDGVIETIKGLEFIKGNDANESEIEKRITAKIPKSSDIEQSVLSKIPKVNEDRIVQKTLSRIPKVKQDLKVVNEKVAFDPMAIIDEIMALPEEKRNKLKLKTENVDGLSQTISAFQSQLGRGYLHGGGISTVAHDSTLTGNGTTASPLSVVGGVSGGTLYIDQTPAGDDRTLLIGDVDGVNTTFVTSTGTYTAGKILITLNGQSLTEGASYDFVETNAATGTIDFITPPETGDRIIAQYI